MLALLLAALAAAAPEPAAQPLPALEGDFTQRGVLTAEANLRRGPDGATLAVAAVPAGTLVAVDPAPAARFVRVRLAGGATGFVPGDAVARGAAAEAAWESPARVAAPGPVDGEAEARSFRRSAPRGRVEFGFGWLATRSGEPGSPDLKGARIHGGAFLGALTVSAPVLEGLLVGGEGWITSTVAATNDGGTPDAVATGAFEPSSQFALLGIAPALTMLGRGGAHLTIAPGVGVARVKANGPWQCCGRNPKDWSPRIGFAARASAGLDFRLDDEVVFGPAISVAYGRNPDRVWKPARWDTWSWSLGASVGWR